MEIKSRRAKERRVGAVSALTAAIEALGLAKEISGFIPASAVFGSVSVILAMIRVSFLLFHFCQIDRRQTETRLGHDGQSGGLCRTWAGLRRSLYHPRPGIEREEVG